MQTAEACISAACVLAEIPVIVEAVLELVPDRAEGPVRILVVGIAEEEIARAGTADFIEDNCSRNIRLQELAALAGAVAVLFQPRLQERDWLAALSMAHEGAAAESTGDARRIQPPVNQIAIEAGFADQTHLTRTFRRLTGSTPAAWRRTQRR